MTLVHAGGPWRSPRPVLLAERSRTARAESRCCLCGRLVGARPAGSRCGRRRPGARVLHRPADGRGAAVSMRGRRAQRRRAAAEATRLVECTGPCRRTFAGRGAYDQAHDPRWPGGCLPTSAIESLLVFDDRNQAWYSRGTAPR